MEIHTEDYGHRYYKFDPFIMDQIERKILKCTFRKIPSEIYIITVADKINDIQLHVYGPKPQKYKFNNIINLIEFTKDFSDINEQRKIEESLFEVIL